MRRTSLPALLFTLSALLLPASRAEAFFLKGGMLFNAEDTAIDTDSKRWIAGFGSDLWMNEVFGVGFEVDFTFDSTDVPGLDERQTVYFIYPALNAKFRLPTRGAQLYVGGGLGYNPIFTSFAGTVDQIGGIGGQFLAGVSFGGRRAGAGSLFVEAQYKITDIEDAGSHQLFTLTGGIQF